MDRRVAAIVLPQLACEIVRQRGVAPGRPLGVILCPELPSDAGAEVIATAVLDVVSDEARHDGVRAGQKVTEAAALVAGLEVRRVTHGELDAALGRVAELALAFGTTAAIELEQHPAPPRRASRPQTHRRITREAAGRMPERKAASAAAAARRAARSAHGNAPFDTVWLDVSGAAHLVGGEAALIDELVERATALGHRARVAIADGPRLAQALARWGDLAVASPSTPGVAPRAIAGGARDAEPGPHPGVAPPGQGGAAIAGLPACALPIDDDTASWLIRLGVLLVADVARLAGSDTRAALASRLGARATDVLDLVAGRDSLPLVPFHPPPVIVEETSFEDGVESAESLLFVLRGMTSRASARLGARGEACTALEVSIVYDRSIARLRAAERGAPVASSLELEVELPAPLARESDLLRTLKARLERAVLAAPAVAVRLTLPKITRAPQVQLNLSRDVSVSPDALPALLAELSAEIGAERVGVLACVDAHRPEARSTLVSALSPGEGRTPGALGPRWAAVEPTRWLPSSQSIGTVARGAVIAVGKKLYAIEATRFVMRLDGVEWWSPTPASRDYLKAWLNYGGGQRPPHPLVHGGGQRPPHPLVHGGGQRPPHPRAHAPGTEGAEAVVYVDRVTGEGFLQGLCE